MSIILSKTRKYKELKDASAFIPIPQVLSSLHVFVPRLVPKQSVAKSCNFKLCFHQILQSEHSHFHVTGVSFRIKFHLSFSHHRTCTLKAFTPTAFSLSLHKPLLFTVHYYSSSPFLPLPSLHLQCSSYT